MPRKIPLIPELERKKETQNVTLGKLIHVHTLKNMCMYNPVSYMSGFKFGFANRLKRDATAAWFIWPINHFPLSKTWPDSRAGR